METDRLHALKRHVFFELLDTVGRVYLVIRYSEQVKIGRRGFLEEEKQQGLVLVINQKMNLIWEDGAIQCRLVFGQTPEDCYIPEEFVVGINSPEAQTQFLCLAETPVAKPPEAGSSPVKPVAKKKGAKKPASGKVVTVDFTKKK